MNHANWNGFKSGVWQDEINVRDFILTNFKEYTGDDSFLVKATDRTNALMERVNTLFTQSVGNGVFGINKPSGFSNPAVF